MSDKRGRTRSRSARDISPTGSPKRSSRKGRKTGYSVFIHLESERRRAAKASISATATPSITICGKTITLTVWASLATSEALSLPQAWKTLSEEEKKPFKDIASEYNETLEQETQPAVQKKNRRKHKKH